MNALSYSAIEQAKFSSAMRNLSGYKTFTTFFGDLSIAECYGASAVKQTFNQVVKSWGKNVKYFTEFVLALNHKIWEHYKKRPNLARVYDELWRKAEDHVFETFSEDDIQYYYSVTD